MIGALWRIADSVGTRAELTDFCSRYRQRANIGHVVNTAAFCETIFLFPHPLVEYLDSGLSPGVYLFCLAGALVISRGVLNRTSLRYIVT